MVPDSLYPLAPTPASSLGGYLRVETVLNGSAFTNSNYSVFRVTERLTNYYLVDPVKTSTSERAPRRVRRGTHLLPMRPSLDFGYLSGNSPATWHLVLRGAGSNGGTINPLMVGPSVARSASTTLSSSSPASRWVKPSRSSTLPE